MSGRPMSISVVSPLLTELLPVLTRRLAGSSTTALEVRGLSSSLYHMRTREGGTWSLASALGPERTSSAWAGSRGPRDCAETAGMSALITPGKPTRSSMASARVRPSSAWGWRSSRQLARIAPRRFATIRAPYLLEIPPRLYVCRWLWYTYGSRQHAPPVSVAFATCCLACGVPSYPTMTARISARQADRPVRRRGGFSDQGRSRSGPGSRQTTGRALFPAYQG